MWTNNFDLSDSLQEESVTGAYMAYNVAVDAKNFIFLFCMVYTFFGVKRKPILFLRVMVSLTLISYTDNKIWQQG